MKRLIVLLCAMMVLLLAACSAETAPEAAVVEGEGVTIKVFHSPT